MCAKMVAKPGGRQDVVETHAHSDRCSACKWTLCSSQLILVSLPASTGVRAVQSSEVDVRMCEIFFKCGDAILHRKSDSTHVDTQSVSVKLVRILTLTCLLVASNWKISRHSQLMN